MNFKQLPHKSHNTLPRTTSLRKHKPVSTMSLLSPASITQQLSTCSPHLCHPFSHPLNCPPPPTSQTGYHWCSGSMDNNTNFARQSEPLSHIFSKSRQKSMVYQVLSTSSALIEYNSVQNSFSLPDIAMPTSPSVLEEEAVCVVVHQTSLVLIIDHVQSKQST